MIRTKKQVLIDAENDVWGVVYIQTGNQSHNDKLQLPVVHFDVDRMIVVQEERIVKNEQGHPEKRLVKFLHTYKSTKAIYKKTTFENKFAGLTTAQMDQKTIESIHFVNEKTRNNGWTGNEIQKVSYWAKPETGGITAADLEIVIPEMLIEEGIILL